MNKQLKVVKTRKPKPKRKFPKVKPALLVFYEHDSDLLNLAIEHFCNYFSGRERHSYAFEESRPQKILAGQIDKFDEAYRKYIINQEETLRKFSKLVRGLKECELYNDDIIPQLIEDTENAIMKYELYELMPRHRKAKKKILKNIKSLSPI